MPAPTPSDQTMACTDAMRTENNALHALETDAPTITIAYGPYMN